MPENESVAPIPPPIQSGWRERLKPWNAWLADAALFWLFLLMIEFLVIAFSGRRGPTGLLVTPEETLDLLHYSWVTLGALALAAIWHFGYRQLGASPGKPWCSVSMRPKAPCHGAAPCAAGTWHC